MVCHKTGYMLALVGALCCCKGLHGQDVLVTGLEQLSALKGYIRTAEEGYRIVTDGIHLIGDIKGGEFDLHRIFFSSLKEVDQAVLHAPELRNAYVEAAATERLFDQALKTYAASGWLQPQEVHYLAAIQQRVADEGRENVAALQMLVQDEALSMTDGGRLQHIQEQQKEVHSRYVRVVAYLVGIGGLITGRAKEQAYTQTLKTWYGFK